MISGIFSAAVPRLARAGPGGTLYTTTTRTEPVLCARDRISSASGDFCDKWAGSAAAVRTPARKTQGTSTSMTDSERLIRLAECMMSLLLRRMLIGQDNEY